MKLYGKTMKLDENDMKMYKIIWKLYEKNLKEM